MPSAKVVKKSRPFVIVVSKADLIDFESDYCSLSLPSSSPRDEVSMSRDIPVLNTNDFRSIPYDDRKAVNSLIKMRQILNDPFSEPNPIFDLSTCIQNIDEPPSLLSDLNNFQRKDNFITTSPINSSKYFMGDLLKEN